MLVGITHDAPEGDYQAMGPAAYQRFVESRNLDEPSNVPAWSWVAEDFPSCTGRMGLADSVVVVDSGADAQRLPFDRAWDLNHDGERANDVWAVGTLLTVIRHYLHRRRVRRVRAALRQGRMGA